LGDWELGTEKSEDAMGMDIDSWVAGNEQARLAFSSERPGQESLALGHSSKKGRSVWFSCFAAESMAPKSEFPRKESGCCLSIFDSELTVL
jgi:hypothetical protein